MILYNRLWNTLAKKGISQYKLVKTYGFSAGQIGRLKKNMHVSTHTLDVLCRLLDCQIQDLVEYIPDVEEELSGSAADLSQMPSTDASKTTRRQEEPTVTSNSHAGAASSHTGDAVIQAKPTKTPENTQPEKSRKSKKEKNKKTKKGKKK